MVAGGARDATDSSSVMMILGGVRCGGGDAGGTLMRTVLRAVVIMRGPTRGGAGTGAGTGGNGSAGAFSWAGVGKVALSGSHVVLRAVCLFLAVRLAGS